MDIAGTLKETSLRTAVISLVFGICCAFATGYLTSGDARCTIDVDFFVALFLSAILVWLLLEGLQVGLYYLAKQPDSDMGFLSHLLYCENKSAPTQVVRLALPMLVLWLPYLLLSYPGNLSNDTSGQVAMYFAMFDDSVDYPLSNHHPIFDTLIFGGIIYPVSCVTGNARLGLAVCILVQMIFTATSFSVSLTCARRVWRISPRICSIAWALVALFPLFPLIVVSLSKDAFFGWLYVLFFTLVADTLIRGFRIPNYNRRIAAFVVLGALLGLSKQFGAYVVIGSLALVAVFGDAKRSEKLKMLMPCATTAIVMWLILPSALVAFNVQPGGQQEALSVPFQQSALTYIRHSSEMSPDEVEIINEALIVDVSELSTTYDPFSADYIKGFSQNGRTFDRYLETWAKQGLRYPIDYIDAWAALEAPLFSTATIQPVFSSELHSWDPGVMPESFYEKPAFASVASEVMHDVYHWIARIPVLSLPLMPTFYVFVVPLTFLLMMSRRTENRRNMLLILTPVALSVAGLLVSPTVREGSEMMRYTIPFLYTTPIILMICVLPKMPLDLGDRQPVKRRRVHTGEHKRRPRPTVSRNQRSRPSVTRTVPMPLRICPA